jgi:thiamine-phosphate pyrophosphorylase
LPHADAARIIDLAEKFKRAGKSTVFVNDRVDIARIVNAAGVHLPAGGLATAAARKLLQPNQLIGRSTHSADQALRAFDDGADYVFLGPVWETSSHPGQKPLGLSALEKLGARTVIAIGGITGERVAQCRDAGAWGVAAISTLWKAADPAAVARAMLLSFEAG